MMAKAMIPKTISKIIYLAVHHAIDIGCLIVGAMVFDTAVIEDITSYLTSPLYLLLACLNLRLGLEALLHGAVVELALQEQQGFGTVLWLVTGLGVLDEDFFFLAGIRVGIPITQTDTGFNLIHILTTGTTRTESIPGELGRIYIHLDGIIHQRSNKDTGKTGHSLALSIERRYTHQTVHTVLALQIAISVLAALDGHGHALDTSLITFLHIGDGYLVAMSLSPAHIHTHQHLRPILTFRTTGTGIDLEHAKNLIYSTQNKRGQA